MALTRRALRKRALIATALGGVLTLSSVACAGDRTKGGAASSEDFPDKDIHLIVQAAPGGVSDMTARALAKEMEKGLGKSIVVENRPGAAGSIAMKYVAGSKPDGYTIAYLPVEVSMLGHLGYPVKPESFTLLGQVVNAPAVITVPKDSPYRKLDDLIAAAKKKPGTITVANSGPGSIWEAATNLLGDKAGVKFKPVPFDGGAPGVNAAAGGKVDAAASAVSEAAPAVKDGRLRALAVFDTKRSGQFPDVPTTAEEGHELVVGGWGGIGAPANLPEPVAAKLRDLVKKAANSPGFTQVLTKAGAVPVYKDSAAFTTFAGQESKRFAGVLGKNGS